MVRPAQAVLGPLPEAAQASHAGRSGRALGLVLLTCLTAQVVVASLLLRPGAFWSPDSAVRFVQVESLLQSHYRDVAVPYPAASLDPDGRYFPFGPWFHFKRGDRFHISYLPYFSMVSAPLYRLFGFPGLLLIPAAAGVGVVWVTYHALRLRAPGLAWAGALATGLGTPLLLYGAVFWDHTTAVVLSTGALALLCAEVDRLSSISPARMAAAGALLGAGLWVRSEMYLLALAAVCGWLCAASSRNRVRGLLPLAYGLAVPAACLWAVNTRLFGSPLGWKGQDLVVTRIHDATQAVSGHPPGSWIVERLGNAYYQLASPDFYAFNGHAVGVGLALALGLVLAGLLLRIGVAWRSSTAVALGGLVGLGTSLLILSGRTVISGLLLATPLVVLAFLPGSSSRWDRFLWVVCALFAAAVIVTGTHGGLQWGPRYLLPILPALIWLAASAVGRVAAPQVWPVLRVSAMVLLGTSLLIQASGVDQVLQAMQRDARINEWLREVPSEVVVTPLEWLTLGAGPVYFEKQLMLVHSPEEFKTLVAQLSARRVARWAYIPFQGAAFAPQGVKKWTEGSPWRFRPVDDRTHEGLRFVTFAGSPSSP